MKYNLVFSFAIILGIAMPAGQVQAAGWICSATGLKAYRYSGGNKAYIHLKPYGSGHNYPVTRVSDTRVEGRTKDGTDFVCTKK